MDIQIKSSNDLVGSTKFHLLSVQKILLFCGILSSLLYVAGITIGATKWEGYSPFSQSVSELFAIDAPTVSFMVPLLVIYAILIYTFGIGIWQSAGSRRTLRIAAVLIICKEILGVMATIATPMHLRGSNGTISDTMHAIFTAAGVLLCMFPAIGFGGVSFGKRFRIYSFVTMVIFLTCGILAGLEGPRVAANLPTPWLGVWERINIYTYMLWIGIFAVTLLRNLLKASEENF